MRAALILVLTLAGCAMNPPEPYVWSKADMGSFDQDLRQCLYEAQKARATADWRIHNTARIHDQVHKACMESKGYALM